MPQQFDNIWTGEVRPARKPEYFNNTPPIWKQSIKLGESPDPETDDVRHYTQVKVWIKGANEQYPSTACFFSIVNSKGSVFVRLNSIDELKILISKLASFIPEMEKIIENQKPIEIQYAMARSAYYEALRQAQEQNPNKE